MKSLHETEEQPAQEEEEQVEEEEEEEERKGPFTPTERRLTPQEAAQKRKEWKAAMKDSLGTLRPITDYPWVETLLVVSGTPTVVEDIENDHERELVFTKQALEAAIEGCSRLDELGVPFRRPPDYYAEMVKTDAHMVKVKERLGDDKRRAEAAERAKRQRELRKFGKEIQKQKVMEREEVKKKTEESVKDWKKKHKAGDEFPIELFDDGSATSGAKRAKKGGAGGGNWKKRQRGDEGEGAPGRKKPAWGAHRREDDFRQVLGRSIHGDMNVRSKSRQQSSVTPAKKFGRRSKTAMRKRHK